MRTSRNNPSPAPRRQSGRTPTGAAGLAAERARSSVMAFVPETIDERAASESAIAMLLGQAELLVPGPDGRPRSLESEAAHAARSLRTLSAPLPEGRQREFEAFCLREAEMRGRGQGVPSAS